MDTIMLKTSNVKKNHDMYCINVDSKVFRVFANTISKYKYSRLNMVLESKIKDERIIVIDNNVFVDADPNSFEQIILLLRGYDINKKGINLNNIKKDIEYFIQQPLEIDNKNNKDDNNNDDNNLDEFINMTESVSESYESEDSISTVDSGDVENLLDDIEQKMTSKNNVINNMKNDRNINKLNNKYYEKINNK